MSAAVRTSLRLAALALYLIVALKWAFSVPAWGHFGMYSACGSWLMKMGSVRGVASTTQVAIHCTSACLFALSVYRYAAGAADAMFMPQITVSVVLLKVGAYFCAEERGRWGRGDKTDTWK